MKSRKSRGRQNRPAAEMHADDGVDPRAAFSRITHRTASKWKDEQIARLAQRAIDAALAALADDVLLASVHIERIEIGGGGSLRVFVRCADDAAHRQADRLALRLEGLRGYLRAAVARELNRRRAAELSFSILPPIGGDA